MRRAIYRSTRSKGTALAIFAAVAPLACWPAAARGGGNFDADELSLTNTWNWTSAISPMPGINWDLDTLPTAAQGIFLSRCGDGTLDMNGVMHGHPSLTFDNWVSYDLTNGTFTPNSPASTITVGGTVGATDGSDYFADGNKISGGLVLGALQPTQVLFTHAQTGAIRFQGAISGMGSLTLGTAVAVGSTVHSVYFDNANAGYTGSVMINPGVQARLLGSGRTGTGTVQFGRGGSLAILSDSAAGEAINNNFTTPGSMFLADHNYTANPLPLYVPGITHTIQSVTVDDPAMPGAGAGVFYSADNGYNYLTRNFTIQNAAMPGVAVTRAINVVNGDPRFGIAGSVLMTGPNRLQELVVTNTIGAVGSAGAYSDKDPAGFAQILNKYGTGVVAFNGNNMATSGGAKDIWQGVLRFNTAGSYGRTAGGAVPTVTLQGGGMMVPVDSAMGVGYNVALPTANLATTGFVPGQSGAMDIDLLNHNAAINLNTINTAGATTGYRIGSSGTGSHVAGAITPFSFGAGAWDVYYLGGGGGTLTIATPLVAGPNGFQSTHAEMGTTGKLLPGRVVLSANQAIGGTMDIRAGTLEIAAAVPNSLMSMSVTSVNTYSSALTTGCAYTGVPVPFTYDGPGQLLLDAATYNGGGYNFNAAGSFGAGGLTLDGGAIGFNGNVNFGIVPATFPPGRTLSSMLYTSAHFPGLPQNTNIMHWGGEYSSGTMIQFFPVVDFVAPTPTALIKSGINSVLDLTVIPLGAMTYTGGTGIMGGEVLVSSSGQLGPSAVVICDGGTLHVGTGFGPPPAPIVSFPQVLRVANGPERRASTVQVDPGITADFSANFFEADALGSVLRVTGGGTVQIAPPFIYPTMNMPNSWGLRASMGSIVINQLPGTVASNNGSAIFDGGTMQLVSPLAMPGIPIPPVVQYHPNYGFGGLQTYATTISNLQIGNGAFFRITGGRISSLMGALNVTLGNNAVFQMAEDAAGLGGDNRGTGTMTFSGAGAVQFNPTGLGTVLFPRDGGFTLNLDNGVLFSGCERMPGLLPPEVDFNGNLYFNPSSALNTVTIDAATVSSVPVVSPSIWTIGGTGWTSWNGTVIKGSTEAVPGSGGPFVSGIVNIDRCGGAPVAVNAGASLTISAGTLNAGGKGDPFTDSSTALHLPVVNNAAFNITTAAKHVASITGTGTTTVFAGARLDVGSIGPVQQGNFTVAGAADAGNVDVTGTTSIGASPAYLSASYVRGNTLSIAGGTARIKDNGSASGTSNVANLSITGGQLDLRDNKMVVTATPIGTWNGTAYTGVTGMVQTGYNGGAQSGSGIITSMTDAISPSVLTAIAVASAQDVKGITGAQTALFSGQTVVPGDTLLMYTYGGDANLSGFIDADDYFQIDSNYNKSGSVFGYFNGDFDYDGLIDGNDYFIIDSAYSGQGAPFSTSSPALAGGVSTVPEPAGVAGGLLLAAAIGRRSRRRAGTR